jgi:Fe-S oxidoreductase
LATTCPFCRKNLEDAREDGDLEVEDLAVLVRRNVARVVPRKI